MVELFLNNDEKKVILKAHIVFYGDASNEQITEELRNEIETMWNEPEGVIKWNENYYSVQFEITASYHPLLTEMDVLNNTNPQNNYFRIEEYSPINISWVDGVGSNTGYFLLSNLYLGSTTASHEFGHSIGLNHPLDLNLIGKGAPGIMYPRGTLVDRNFQYDPTKQPGEAGGTMHPVYRKVHQEDIDLLEIPKHLSANKKYLGEFTSKYHDKIVAPVVA